MTLKDLEALPILITRSIGEAAREPKTHNYIVDCVKRFFRGDYGEVGDEDTEANNNDLEYGEGHVLARYKPKYELTGDFYIEAYFSESYPGEESNHTMIMYCEER